MKNKLVYSLVFIIWIPSLTFGQEPEIEKLVEQTKEYSDISELMEMLAELEQNPIDLNRATVEQLILLPWISNVSALAIINYRDQIGGFTNVGELIQVANMNPDLIQYIQKYITILPKSSRKKFFITTKTRLSQKLKYEGELEKDSYDHSPLKAYNRLNFNYEKNLRLGLLLEKDSGERRIDDLKIYFLSYHDNANQNRLIIGNYRLEVGQGLVFGNPYGYYKGSDPIYAAKIHRRNLLEYSLVDENASLYGVSGQYCFSIYQFIIFYSSKKLDATVNSDGTFESFYTSGYHRNSSEMNKKDRLNEQLIGSRLQIRPSPNFLLGTTYYRSLFDHSAVIKNEEQRRFAFKGKTNEVIGIDCNLTLYQFNIFGEFARSKNNGFGLLAGILLEAQNLQVVILSRNYSKNFNSFYGNSFSEQSNNLQNEQGIFFGFQLKSIKNLRLGIYFDQFKLPWRSYFVPMPSSGKDFLLKVEHKVLKKLILSLQFKNEEKDQYLGEIKSIIPRNQMNLRIQIDFQPINKIKLRSRMEKVNVSYQRYKQLPSCYPSGFEGLLLYQDTIFQLNHNFDIAARLTLFDTDGYESRVYQFEHDVAGMLTNQMLFGKGTRNYIRIRWGIKKNLDLSIKLGSTQYQYQFADGTKAGANSAITLNYINLQLETKW